MKRYIVIATMVLALSLFAVGCASGATAVEATAAPTVAEIVMSTDEPAATAALTASPTPQATATPTATAKMGTAADGTLELTLDQLKQYDGKNGNPAYIAVDGILYDVTNVGQWSNGKHNGYTAGKDLTDAIKNKSPHGTSKLNGVPIVGKLIG